MAQLVERLHGMEKVRGSIPLSSTKKALLRGHERDQRAGLLPFRGAVGPMLYTHVSLTVYGVNNHRWWLPPVVHVGFLEAQL